MWKEYAVQPECLVQSWAGFRALFFLFGPDQGRWLAKYPAKDWWPQFWAVFKSSNLTDGERKKIEESMLQMRFREKTDPHRSILRNSGRPHDPKLDWLLNAERVDKPFAGIIALCNPRNHRAVRIHDEFAPDDEIFQSPAHISVPRTADAIATSVQTLLAQSNEIILIDPNFGCLEQRFQRFSSVLLAIVRFISANKEQPPSRFEYHLAQKSLYLDPKEWTRRLTKRLTRELPERLNIDFRIWKQRPRGEKLHDRFILTELGGVDISVGLDEGEDGETTKISRLSPDVYEKTWQDYAKDSQAFELCFQHTVKGSG